MNLIHDKLKQQVPADKQLQCSHFVRLVESLNELGKVQTTDLQTLISFQFPQHTFQMLCNALGFIIAKQGNESIKQVVEVLLQFIAKKGSQKSIALTLLITLIQLTYHEIQPFSYTLTQDITAQLMKLLKGSDYRVLLCNAFQFLIETQKQEILKHALKFAQNDKNDVLMQAGLQGLMYLMEKDVISEQILVLVYKFDESPIFFKFFGRYLFQQQAIIQLTKKDKAKQLQPREQAQRIFQLFDENLSKFPSNITGNIFLAYKKYLMTEYKRLGLPIIRGSFEISCSYLNSMQLDDPFLHTVYKKSSELCHYMIQQVQLNERKELLDYFFDKITKAKNQKWNVYVYKILLKGMNFLFDTLGSLVFDEKRSKPSEFIDTLTPIFRINDLLLHPNSIDRPICVSVSRNIFGLFESFFRENKKWQQSILSALLNYAKISLADLSVKEANSTLNILKIQCALLSKLFQQLDLSIHSVSSELINHLWDSAKSFLNKSNAFKRIGWMVIAELLMVPYFGTANKVKEIGGLIEQTLNTKDEIKDELQLLNYCSVGLVIISILTCPSLSKTIKDTTKKFLAQQTIAMYQKLQQCKFDKTSPIMISCKYIFYQTIRQVTPKYYSNELNSLVQFSLDDIVNCNSKWTYVDIHKSNHYVDELFGIPRSEFQLIAAASKFLGHILSSTSFTLKNKINFIRYVNGTLQTQVVNLKDQQNKISKQQCYLFCVYQIAVKLNQGNTTVSQEFNEQIFQIVNLCQNDQTSELCAVLYCAMLQIKDVDQAEQLNLLLSQHSTANYTHLVIEIIKKKLSGVQLQVQNLFMKVVSHMTNDVAKIISLFEKVDHHFLKNAWVFLVFALSQSEKPVQINEFKKLTHIILNYVRNNGIKDIYLTILYQECRYRLQQKPFYILQLDFAMEQDTEETVQKTMQLLIKKPTTKIATFLDYLTDKYNSVSFLKPILFVLNHLFTNQRVHSTSNQMELRNKMKNIFVKVYNIPITDLLQLLQPYILEEFIPEDENRTPIHIKTRIFLLKRLQKLFKLCETSIQVFDFLFKITTSNYEEAKEISFDMFQHFFQKEKDLLSFAAQIDSILCDTIRREIQNPPSVNLTNMKLISKFAKIVKDEVLATKLIQLLSKPLILESRKKLVPSQFFSEKSQLNILIQRVLSLGSIYRKIPNYFDQQIIEQLRHYIEELLEDFFVILCTPRSHVREYQKYNFVYNGKKYSYDSQFINQSLPKLLRISLLNKPIHYTLIGYVITQQGSFEQSESFYKKTAECLSKDKVQQTNAFRIKGIQLLTEAFSRNPKDQLLIQGIQNLLPIIAVEAPYSLTVCQAFYQTLVQYQVEYQQIVDPILQIYTLATENNLKLSCLITLLKLITTCPQYQDQIITLYWDYLLSQEYDFMRCNQLIQYLHEKINPLKSQGYIQHVLANLSVNEELRQEECYLLLNINCLINNTQDQQKYQILINRHFTILINTAINIANQKKSNTQLILATLLPAIYHQIANNESTQYLVIVKFLLLSYLLANDKTPIFQHIFRLLSLFSSEEDPNIQTASKQAMKVILMNTQFQQCQLTEQVYAKVYAVYQEIQQEIKTRKRITIKTTIVTRCNKIKDVWMNINILNKQKMSLLSDRCKTDPDDECEIKKRRKQVQQFIHNSKEQQKQLTLLFKKDLDIQSQKIKERIQKRNFKKPISKSQSCGTYTSQPASEQHSLADTEDYQEAILEETILELDNQRDEKIYRIVQHYNNQINNLRMLEFNEETLSQMLVYEKRKWEEIQTIQDQYETIKQNSLQQ